MKTRSLTDLVRFGDDTRVEVLAETERLFSQVVCLQGSQTFGPVADPSCDALVTVLAGEVAAQVGRGRARMKQWESVVAEAGHELTVTNASDEPSVVLLVLAPPPPTASVPVAGP
jgi:quercetin dioxygenase-like cupin family protein